MATGKAPKSLARKAESYGMARQHAKLGAEGACQAVLELVAKTHTGAARLCHAEEVLLTTVPRNHGDVPDRALAGAIRLLTSARYGAPSLAVLSVCMRRS